MLKGIRVLFCLVLAIAMGWPSCISAQPGEKRFFPLEQLDDLRPASKTIYQDSLGFMWFGSELGLLRFDGQNIKTFTYDKSDSLSLLGHNVEDFVSPDGLNFWIATTKGLNYFDRQSQQFQRFVHDPENPESLGEDFIRSLEIDGKGNVWLGLKSRGLDRLNPKTGIFEHFQPGEAEGQLSGGSISTVFEDKAGRLWVGTEKNGLNCRLPGTDNFLRYTTEDTLPDGSTISANTIRDLLETESGEIMIGTSGGGLCIFDPSRPSFRAYRHDPNDSQTLSSDEAYSVYLDSRGGVWVGTWARGLNYKEPGSDVWQRHGPQDGVDYSFPGEVVLDIFEDRRGLIWFGTQYKGPCWYDPLHDQFVWYQNNPFSASSLSKNNTLDILELSPDTLLIGTYNDGLNLYDRASGKFTHYKKNPEDPSALPNNGIWSLLRDRKGRIWVGSSGGLSEYNPHKGTFKTYRKDYDNPEGLSNQNVLCISEDREGKLWVGTWGGGMNVFDPTTGKFRRFVNDPDDPRSIAGDAVKSILHDRDGNVWAGTTRGLSKLDKGTGTFTNYRWERGNANGLFDPNINTMWQTSDGRIWIGTNLGLHVMEAGDIRLVENSVLEQLGITAIMEDKIGMLWIGTFNGLFRLDPGDFSTVPFMEAEGVPYTTFKLWSYHVGPSGKMYLGTSRGLLEFDPATLDTARTGPQMVLTGFYLSNRPIRPGESPALSQNISLSRSISLSHDDYLFSLQFSALNFQLGDRIRYKYRLKGFDQDWIETDQFNRRATYTNVPPGNYTFQVRSASSGGEWSEEGLELTVRVLPPWWKTWWARGLFILAGILVVAGFFWFRIRELKRQKAVLEAEVKSRTMEIREQNAQLRSQKDVISEEKAISEALLLNILPQKVAEELKQKQKATPRFHPEVTVLFLDFVGFTKISTEMSAQELITILDEYFVEFDRIVTRHGLEKIKTIGDAYMCAGGIPEAREDHCMAVVQAGLEMLAYVKQSKMAQEEEGREVWRARVGIHTGEVIAGVVGEKKFAYDIWGDTVNTASRIETNGLPGEVNISAEVYEVVKEDLECVYQGKVNAKNKGLVDLYTVVAG